MLPINQYITVRNRTMSNRTRIQYLVIHYVGAVSNAKSNCNYFYVSLFHILQTFYPNIILYICRFLIRIYSALNSYIKLHE